MTRVQIFTAVNSAVENSRIDGTPMFETLRRISDCWKIFRERIDKILLPPEPTWSSLGGCIVFIIVHSYLIYSEMETLLEFYYDEGYFIGVPLCYIPFFIIFWRSCTNLQYTVDTYKEVNYKSEVFKRSFMLKGLLIVVGLIAPSVSQLVDTSYMICTTMKEFKHERQYEIDKGERIYRKVQTELFVQVTLVQIIHILRAYEHIQGNEAVYLEFLSALTVPYTILMKNLAERQTLGLPRPPLKQKILKYIEHILCYSVNTTVTAIYLCEFRDDPHTSLDNDVTHDCQ